MVGAAGAKHESMCYSSATFGFVEKGRADRATRGVKQHSRPALCGAPAMCLWAIVRDCAFLCLYKEYEIQSTLPV